MRVAVTGAAGFLGRAVARELVAGDHAVIELVRHTRNTNDARIESRRYELDDTVGEALLDQADAVVHCAFARADRVWPDAFATNVEGTLRLFERASERNIPFLFVSSLSAVPEAPSVYGRQKFALETMLGPRGACIVRPGLLMGNGGLVAGLVETMRRRRVLPLVDGGRQPVQCVWRDDVAAIVRALVERRCPASSLTVAAEPASTVGELAYSVRRALRLRAITIRLPFSLAFAAAAVAEFAGFVPPLSTENLLGLRSARLAQPDDIRPLGLTLLSLDEQLERLAAQFALNCSDDPGTPQPRDR
jgi:nucleoside-diphosphate-sugar epimerase